MNLADLRTERAELADSIERDAATITANNEQTAALLAGLPAKRRRLRKIEEQLKREVSHG